jgi:hypothetical protein
VRDSPLHTELLNAWKLFVAGDEATDAKHQHLFRTQRTAKLPFVAFQQAVIGERLAGATEAEITALDVYIEQRFQHDVDIREHPWQALKVSDIQSEVELQRQFLEE